MRSRFGGGPRRAGGARLRLVADNERLHEFGAELRESGKRLWHFARHHEAEAVEQELAERLDGHRELLDDFVRVAQLSLRHGSLRV